MTEKTNHFFDKQFWLGKRVLITGHTGFKGSWLSVWLQSLGAELAGYALVPPTNPSLFEAADVGKYMNSTIGDVRDLDSLKTLFRDFRPEIVLHMAAQPLVRQSYLDPHETYSINVMGTVNLFEAVRSVDSVKVVLNVTSDKCYENREWEWGYREVEPLGGFDPYSNSKACSELVAAAYRSSFFNQDNYGLHGVAVATARAGNVIGGGDWASDRLIPDMIRAITCGESINIRNPSSIRPWQHVLEPLSGYLLLAQKLYQQGPVYSGAWNFGPSDSDAKQVSWIVEKVVSDWAGASWKLDGDSHPHEAKYLKLDCSKARTCLDWQPKWGVEQAIKETNTWYKAFQDGFDMREFCLKQISHYCEGSI